MKNIIFAIAAAASITASAQETIKTLYEGNPVEVTWENTLKIEAENFSSDVKAGDYIYITFDRTSDVIELKSDGTWLPGTRFVFLGDNTPELKTYITTDMLESLKATGLELCGASFTVNTVSICNDGFVMPEGAIWGGYFWVDNWNTLELFKSAFNNYNGQRYLDIYLSDDNGDNIGYFMKVLTAWENPDAIWADNTDITHETRKAIVDLKGLNVNDMLADVNTLMIQSNPEGGSPYNITAIALRSDTNGEGAIEVSYTDNNTHTVVYNLQGVKVREGLSSETTLSNLPAGIYIVNGKKIAIR